MSEHRPSGLRILLTNNTLSHRAGSEIYVRDLAIALMKRGHFPIAYSPVLGGVTEDLERATIPVVDDLGDLNEPPDVIHGQHHLETMTAVLRFPQTPAIFVCHGWLPWEELPPVFPTIVRYVAVDDLCRERLLTTKGIQPQSISVIYNFVDLERFKLRAELPERPKSALIFSNYASDTLATRAIKAACRRAGIEQVDVIGLTSGNIVPNPEDVLGRYDVVFAKARSALEAMASGCAVVVADFAGLAGMVTSANVARMRPLNFGARTMQAASITEENVLRELERYDAQDAARVGAWVRADADMASAVTGWLSVYAGALADWRDTRSREGTAALEQQSTAASRYLRSLAPVIKSRDEADLRAHEAAAAQAALAERLASLEEELAAKSQEAVSTGSALAERLANREAELAARAREGLSVEAAFAERLATLEAALAAQSRQAAAARSELAGRDAELEAVYSSRAWKAVTRLRSLTAWLRAR